MCAAQYLASQGRLAGAVFIDTGIACPDARPFVEKVCADRGWDLRVFTAPMSYETMVGKYGFPKDLVGHSLAYGYLKERAIIQARKDLGPETVFASGVRVHESARRKLNIAKGFRHNGGIRIENPIQDWFDADVNSYLRRNELPLSVAYLSLGRSGDCLCGAFSRRGEAAAIRRAYPEVGERIRRLEERIRDEFPYPKNRWGGKRSKGGFQALRGQMTLEQIVCGTECADRPAPPKS